MKIQFDTSVLIAAMLPDHACHSRSLLWLSRAKQNTIKFAVSAHSLVELYAVLTRLPRRPRITSKVAWELINENVTQSAEVVTLSESDYTKLLSELSDLGIVGGQVYDAVICLAAEISGADHLLTLNESHFRRVWPRIQDRVINPDTLSCP